MSKSKGKQDTISIKRFKNGGIYIKPSRKDMLQHYDLGGLINPTKGLNALSAGADMLGGAVTGLVGDSTGGAVAGGALSGAASGAALGPLGMAGGAIIGGLTSLLGSNAKKKQEEELKKQQFIKQRAVDNQQFLQGLKPQQQYQPTFAYGGMINKYPTGGGTKKDPVSEDAMKVSPNFIDQYPDLREQVRKGGIDNPEIYKDPSKLSEYYNMLAGENQGKRTNPTGYQQRYITNFNNYNSKVVGGVYDPNAPGLKMLPSNTQWKPVNPASVDTIPSTYKPVNWKTPQPYDMETKSYIKSDPKGRAMGSGMIGVGNQKYSLGGALHQGTGANINYITQYPNGGIQPNAELEQGEPFRTPDGNISQISNNAPTHEQGGVQLNLPENTQILGKMIDPAFGKEFKELGEKLKRAQDKYKKILDEKPTAIAKRTAKMMLDKIQNQYDTLMQRQESMKSQQNSDQQQEFNPNGFQYPYGGMPLMQNGRVVQYPDGGNTLTRLEPRQGLAVNYNAPTSKLDMTVQQYPTVQQQPNKFNWDGAGDVANTLGSIAPIAYNLGQGLFGKVQQLNPSDYYNPYTNQVNSLMVNRRYDVDPEIQSNRQATAQYYQGLRQGAPSQARYLAGLQTGQIANQRANQDVYARANNANNQYKAEQAQTLQSLGQQEAATKLGIQEMNTKAQAVKNSYLPTALSQLQQMSQTRQMMKGQAKRDKQRLALYKEMFKNYPFDLTKIFE